MDDKLLKNSSRSIPRADVAELTVQCLTLAEARNRCAESCFVQSCACFLYACLTVISAELMSLQAKDRALAAGITNNSNCEIENQAFLVCRSIDVITKVPGDGSPTTDYAALLASLTADCKYGSVIKATVNA